MARNIIISVYRTAKVMGISKDTLKRHLKGQAPNSRPDPCTVLSKRDEAQLILLPNLLPTVVNLHPRLG